MINKIIKNLANRYQPILNVEYLKDDICLCNIRVIDWDGIKKGTAYLIKGTFNITSSIQSMLNKGMFFSSLQVKDIIDTFIFSSIIKSGPVKEETDFCERYNSLKNFIDYYNDKIDNAMKTVIKHTSVYENAIANKLPQSHINNKHDELLKAIHTSNQVFETREKYVRLLNFNNIIDMIEQLNTYKPFDSSEELLLDSMTKELFKNF